MLALWINRDYQEIRKMSSYWDAFADAPWGGTDLYIKLYDWYPSAKFVLTYREPDSWYGSLEKMICEFSNGNLESAIETFHANGRYGFSYFMKANFGIETLAGAKQRIMDQYKRHNDEVSEFMDRNKADYLRFNCVGGEGWEVLCPFLGKSVPDTSYPHLNQAIPSNEPAEKQPASASRWSRPRWEMWSKRKRA
jgi:hypothetical protein